MRCSNGQTHGQWRGRFAAFAFALVVILPAYAAPNACVAARTTPSGEPVPRYVATRFSVVNARGGPGDDFRLLWVYRVQGLPLQVIAETEEWRRVCDPEGAVAWVHRRTVAETRRAMRTSARPLDLHARPDETGRVVAILAGRSLATLGACTHGWCRLSVEHAAGWARAGEVWGVDDAVQCRSPLAARRASAGGRRRVG